MVYTISVHRGFREGKLIEAQCHTSPNCLRGAAVALLEVEENTRTQGLYVHPQN